MKKHLLLLLLAALTILFAACDSSSPTDPTPNTDVELTADFRTVLQNGSLSLALSDSTTGGNPPYIYTWRADFQAPRIATSQNSVTFNYQDECNNRLDPSEALVVTVTLEVRDENDRRDSTSDVVSVCPTS